MNRNSVLNVLGAGLWAYGLTAMGGYFVLSRRWLESAPGARDAIHAFAHSEHGSVVFYSAEQTTALTLLFLTSIPIAFLGMFVMPRKNVVSRSNGQAWRATWDPDDPDKLRRWGYALGVLVAIGLVGFAREALVAGLTSSGVVLNLG